MLLRIRVNEAAVRQDLELLEKRVRDARPFFTDVHKQLQERIKAVFHTEGYGTWPPLSDAYAQKKQQEVGYKTILRYSDRYYESLTSYTDDSDHSISRHGVEVGVRADRFPDQYPLAHEQGRPSKNLPRRSVFDHVEDRTDTANLVGQMERYLFKNIR